MYFLSYLFHFRKFLVNVFYILGETSFYILEKENDYTFDNEEMENDYIFEEKETFYNDLENWNEIFCKTFDKYFIDF